MITLKPPYVPIDQLPYCCVPATICMIMNRHKLSHGTQEEIGHSLGLIVPESVKHYFNHVRTGEKPSSEYGTQVGKRRYSINKYFKENQIPLKEGYHYLTTLDESISFIKNNIALGNGYYYLFQQPKTAQLWKLWSRITYTKYQQ